MTFRLLLFFCFSSFTLFAQSLPTSTIPILAINTKGRTIVNEPKIPVKMRLFDRRDGKLNALTDVPTIEFWAGIEFRGSTSQEDWYFLPGLVKKPYGIEIWTDSVGMVSKRLPLAGLPEESDWVLNASYNDRTFLRDVLAHQWAKSLGLGYSKNRYIELVIDDVYKGVYILFEKIKQGKNRIDIADLTNADNTGDALTGGYVVKIDKASGAQSRSWSSNYNSGLGSSKNTFLVDYPNISSITSSQFNYIRDYVHSFEKSIQEDNPLSPAASYRAKMDVNSFANYFILSESVRNVDGYLISTYLYKDKDSKGGKLTMGPAWDYNLSFGNADYNNGWKPDGWAFKARETVDGAKDFFEVPFWWNKFMRDTVFVYAVQNRWKIARKGFLQMNKISAYMDSTALVMKEPLNRNFGIYPLFGRKVWPNYYVGNTMADEMNWMKAWIASRLQWLDAQMEGIGNIVLSTREPIALATLQPNPAQESVLLTYDVKEAGKVSVFIWDLSGRKIKEFDVGIMPVGRQQSRVDIQTMTEGTYILDLWVQEMPYQRIQFKKTAN